MFLIIINNNKPMRTLKRKNIQIPSEYQGKGIRGDKKQNQSVRP